MATLNMFWYGKGLEHFHRGNIDWTGDTIKVALMAAAFTPAQSTSEFFNSLSNETTGSGYTAGGETLGTKTLTYDDSNVRVVLDAADVSWDPSTITAQYAVIYVAGATPGTDDFVIGYGDAGGAESSDGAAFTIQWHADGILRTTAATPV